MNNSLQKSGFAEKLFFLLVLVWSGVWIGVMRYHFLDDALINLRHAELLAQKGFITFDGSHRTDGISSLLGVSIVAFFDRWFHSAFVLKVTSCLYFTVLLGIFLRKWLLGRGAVRLLWAGLILVSVSPFGMRWLTDGMETSLVLVMSAAMAFAANRVIEKPDAGSARYFFFFLWGLLLILFRIEFAFVILVSSAAVFFSQKKGWTGLVGQSHWALGAAAGFLTARLLTGEWIPDPAIAKTIGYASFSHGFKAIAIALGGGMSFGAGLCILAVFSGLAAGAAAAHKKEGLRAVLAVNSLLLLLYLMTSLRGQEVQGIRHVLWCFYFVIVWNIQALDRLGGGTGKIFSRLLAASYVFLIVLWPFEIKPLSGIIGSRSESFLAMRQEPLRILEGKLGVAFDIGMIAYFSKARICDMMGVVNGREVAHMGKEERMEHCRKQDPVFVFATEPQVTYVANAMDMENWPACSAYTFRNFSRHQTHYLFVSPQIAEGSELCSQPVGRIQSKTLVLNR